ncbi:MAG TPA: peptide ABC transporter ATP-binding protein [Kosmotogaceae bacterium]|nr:MAG: Oligopeptide/dipeptide ABC transporter, ATP-binding protein [Thermotogales bacterium 46_20]HAA85810.1 peptide ABC transporter ATP-binding protein [Kosmotogaceae bacterium]
MTENGKTLLRVDNLVKYFPVRAGVFKRVANQVRAVDGVSFEVKEGETLGLVGESGCGKTTAGMTVLRLHEPTSGRIVAEDVDTTHLFMPWHKARSYLKKTYIDRFTSLEKETSDIEAIVSSLDDEFDKKMARFFFEECDRSPNKFMDRLLSSRDARRRSFRKDAQIIFQDPFSSLNPRMRVKNIIAEGARINKIASGKKVMELVAETMKKVGLSEDHMSRFPHEFSGGQRQRIGIARALILNPKLVVCDEAVSALDVSIQAQILNLLSSLQRDLGLTYLFIAHDLGVVKHISKKIAVMYLGKIAELADRKRLFSNPLHPYTVALLSAIPIPDPERKKTRMILKGDVPSPINPPSGCRFHPRCPIAKDICSKEEPPLEVVDGDHSVACFFAGKLKV